MEKQEERHELGEKLLKLRKQNYLTQYEVAQNLGIPQSTLSQWEHGVGEPSATTLKRLCALYSVSADYMIGLTDECSYYQVYYRDLNERQTMFVEYFNHMTHRRQELLFDLLREMAN